MCRDDHSLRGLSEESRIVWPIFRLAFGGRRLRADAPTDESSGSHSAISAGAVGGDRLDPRYFSVLDHYAYSGLVSNAIGLVV